MLKNMYILKIANKDILKKILRCHIYIEKINYQKNNIFITVDYLNYCNLLKYKKIFDIELVKISGIGYYKYLCKKYIIFIIFFIIGIFYLIFLSNIIFKVNIVTNDKEIRKILENELQYYGIKKYSFVKSYAEKDKIKQCILKDNKDKLEWLEITRKGSTYIINVERRIISNIPNNNIKRNVIARKNAIIKQIRASHGDIVKQVNDYVNKGDVIVAGIIKKNDKIMNYVQADACVYGETWYKVKVNLPINYYDKKYTGKKKKKITLNFFNRRITFWPINKNKNYEIYDRPLFYHSFLPISFNLSTFMETQNKSFLLSDEKVWDIAFNIARKNLLNTLPKDSQILSQKKLKFLIKNSRIELDVFLKVYENITDYQNIKLGDINGDIN